jgi:hypothetical protein
MSTTTILKPSRLAFPTPTAHYICESWWTCYSTPSAAYHYRERIDSLLATEHALSVLPARVQQSLDLVITPVPGWRGQVPTWFGISCRIGRVSLWLPIREHAGHYREFSLLTLLPRADLKDAPPFILLGVQFLVEYRAGVLLDCATASNIGKLNIP